MDELKKIGWNIINCLIAALLVLFGSFSNGQTFSQQSLFFAVMAAAIVFLTKFADFWKTEETALTTQLFTFIK